MNTDVMLFVINYQGFFAILLLLAAGFIFGVVSYAIYSHDKNKPGLPTKIINKLMAGKKVRAKVMEEKVGQADKKPLPGDFDFVKDSGGQTNYGRVCSLLDPTLMIRRLSPEKSDKDLSVYAFSKPHKFDKSIEQEIYENFPQIMVAKIKNDHELSVFKSPAVDLSDFFKSEQLGTAIMRFIFTKLNYLYNWDKIEQVVKVSSYPNKNALGFKLEVEVCFHEDLCSNLLRVDGVDSYNGVSRARNVYLFTLLKKKEHSWNDLRPEIEKVFRDYFPAGVKFTGVWGDGEN